jgi:ribosomal protein S6--L-glutamate ligase
MQVVETMRCYMNITSSHPTIRYRGNNLCDFDAIVPRIGASITFYGTSVVRQFELMGVFCVNESVAISSSRDKLRTLQLLSSMGVGLPATGYARSPDDVEDLIRAVGGSASRDQAP